MLLVAGVATCAALTLGATGAFAADADTRYDAVAVDSPDPGFNSRFAERTTTGDATGDGVTDVFASTWVQEVSGVPGAGKVSMINGATQKIEWSVASPDLQEDGRFGFFISGVDDVNGDGRDDVIAGASGQNVGNNEGQGRGYVLSGADGSLIRRLDNPHPQASASFASRIGSAGDVTGDGVTDLLIGAPSNDIPAGCGNVPAGTLIPDNCRKNEGEVFVFNGATGEHESTINLPPEDVVGPPCGAPDNHHEQAQRPCGGLGANPQNIGDLTGDGIPDFHIPASSYRAEPNLSGRIYIYDGATNQVLIRIDQPDPDPVSVFGLGDLDRGGLGDLNADGIPELYGTGFLQDGPNGEESAGRAWVFDGKSSLETGRGQLLYDLKDPELAPARAFGWAASRTDYNKDGRPDVYISGLQNRLTETWIYDGTDGSLLKTLALPPDVAQESEPGNSGTALGWSSRALGDVNGDGEPDYVAGGPYQDVEGTLDQGQVFFFLSNVSAPPPPSPPAPPGPPAGAGPCGTPGGAGYLNPAKMRVSRARVLREDRMLDVLAPITTRARGANVAVTYEGDQRTDTFDAQVTDADTELDEIRIMEEITRGQADLGTGIVNMTYEGDADTRPEFVRLRAASQRAELDVEEISLAGDRLSAAGSVTDRAEGVVRLRYSYVDPDGSPNVHLAQAEIQEDGDWELENDQVPAQLAQCGGYLSIQFTGYFERRIRGEQLAYELNAGQTRTP